MKKQTKQSFLHGAVILSMATIVVKVVGAVFKIPLANIIGSTGMGYFNTAYNLFNVVYTLAIAGLPIAVAKMVSEFEATGRHRDTRQLLRLSRLLFIMTGLVGSLIMLFGSGLYANAVNQKDPYSMYAVIALAPTIFFACIMSIYRGYYEGHKNMYPTAVSQLVEAVIKTVAGLGLTVLVLWLGKKSYADTGSVFGLVVGNDDAANTLILAFAAAGAVLGVSISTVGGALYLKWKYRRDGDNITDDMLTAAPTPQSNKSLLKKLLIIAIPVCLGAVATSLTSLIDGFSVMNRLNVALENGFDSLVTQYGTVLPANPDEIPNFLYGTYSMAQTLFNLIPAITTAFGVSALPAVASAWILKDHRELSKNVSVALKLTSLIAFPAGIGMCVMAEPIIRLIYANKVDEALIAVPILQVLGLAVLFVSFMAPINSMLQGVGRPDLPVWFLFIGGALKLVVNYTFVAIPALNIKAASWGTFVCYIFIAIASLMTLMLKTRAKISYINVFIKPLFSAVLCGVTAWVSYELLHKIVASNTLCTVGAIGLAAVVYLISLILLKTLSKDDILMLPKGENFVKVLEKRKLLG